MRILIISPIFPDIFGGIADYVLKLSNVLCARKYDVSVITTSDSRVKKDIRAIDVYPVINNWNLSAISDVIKLINSTKADCVILQYEPYMYSKRGVPLYLCLLVLLIWLKGVRLITTFHEVAVRMDYGMPKYIPVAIIQRIIAYTLCLLSFSIIVSINHYRSMLSFFKAKISVIPIGSNFVYSNIQDSELELLKNKVAPVEKYIISTFASKIKNPDYIYRILMQLRSKGVDFKFMIIGEAVSNKMDKFLYLISDSNLSERIHCTGYINSSDINKYILLSDVILIMEDVDGRNWGGAAAKSSLLASVLEAGVPLVTTKGDMTDDFLMNEYNLVFANPNNETQAASTIIEILKDEKLRNKLCKNSVSTYQKYMSWDVASSYYDSILKS